MGPNKKGLTFLGPAMEQPEEFELSLKGDGSDYSSGKYKEAYEGSKSRVDGSLRVNDWIKERGGSKGGDLDG